MTTQAVTAKVIGARLRTARFAANLSVPELSELAGLSHTTIYRVERGCDDTEAPRGPNMATLRKLADALDADVTTWLAA